jgi:phage gp45-like
MIEQLSARLRNLFVTSEFQKRYADGKIQVKTHNGRVLEKKEAFPYGFCARAKNGRAFVFCQGGNFDGFEILPVLGEGGPGPDLEEGDAALYTGSGGWVVCREDGSIEINGKSGKITVQKTGAIELEGATVAVQKNGLAAARQTDMVQSTAADDPDFWKWVATVSAAVAALTGGSLTPPAMIMSKITGGSAVVTIG